MSYHFLHFYMNSKEQTPVFINYIEFVHIVHTYSAYRKKTNFKSSCDISKYFEWRFQTRLHLVIVYLFDSWNHK